MQDLSAKTITRCSRALLSSFSAQKTLPLPTFPVICTRAVSRYDSADESSSHICFELLKNSLRAVVERYGVNNEDSFPPIKVVVVEGSEDITIKISDEGGGIQRSAIPMIWT